MTKLNYKESIAFLRDSFVPFSDATVSIGSSPVLYGLSVYTVFSVNVHPKDKSLSIFRLEDHWKRLSNSARIMDFNTFLNTWNYEKFKKMVRDLIRKNDVREDALVRVSVFVDALLAGTRMRGLPISLSAYVYPAGEILPRTGIDVCVSSFHRVPDNAIPARAKVNGGYANVALMKNEALMNGYHDAIALDTQGCVCEGTIANLFFVHKGELVTPSADFDILEGITRDTVLRLAHDMRIKVIERPISRTELYIFDEAFACGSSARITPILSIDKRKVGNGKIGKMTALFMKKYEEVARGCGKGYEKWRLRVK